MMPKSTLTGHPFSFSRGRSIPSGKRLSNQGRNERKDTQGRP